jgi:CelD/BcsL family acetyltransferase involved in cellulose biosynthesis
VITDSHGLEPLLDPWRRLAQSRGNAFVSPEWYLAALECLHLGAEPVVGVVFSDGEVAGVLPLLKTGGRGRSRRVFTAGPHLADVFQPVTEVGRESHVVEALAPVLAPGRGRWRRSPSQKRPCRSPRWPAWIGTPTWPPAVANFAIRYGGRCGRCSASIECA